MGALRSSLTLEVRVCSLICVGVFAFAFPGHRLAAQGTSACRPADSTSAELLVDIVRIATGTDAINAQLRQNRAIPQVAASNGAAWAIARVPNPPRPPSLRGDTSAENSRHIFLEPTELAERRSRSAAASVRRAPYASLSSPSGLRIECRCRSIGRRA